jgi:hypothetical protein
MPLTPFQKEVLAFLAAARSEESHFAGGIVLNASEESARYSQDFDIFHEAAVEVARASDVDVSNLTAAGYVVEKQNPAADWMRESTYRSARVSRGDAHVDIDWAADSAYRFFPIEQDALFGWRLHHFDLATNKALTLASRTETRDYVDIVALAQHYPMAAICWAACGKDPGFSPLHLLKMMRRFARIDPLEFSRIKARDLDLTELKTRWVKMAEEAEVKIQQLSEQAPDLPIGVAFVDGKGHPGWIGDNPGLRIHAPSLRGCWPSLRLG